MQNNLEGRLNTFNKQIDELLDEAAEKLYEDSDQQDKVFDRLRKCREAMQRLG